MTWNLSSLILLQVISCIPQEPSCLNPMTSSTVADQSFLFDQQAPPTDQSFMLSPPYTPYSCTSNGPATIPPNEMTTPYQQNPSPIKYCDNYSEGTISPPYSAKTATPTYDSTPPPSSHAHHSIYNAISTQQQTMPVNKEVFTTTTTNRVISATSHVTFGNQSNFPNSSIELQTTYIPNGNSTSNVLGGGHEFFDLPPLSMEEMMSPLTHQSSNVKTLPSLVEAPPHVRQSIVNSTRQRYAGAFPARNQFGESVGSTTGHVTGHVMRSSMGSSNSSSVSGMSMSEADSVLQWSQWLKKGAPPAPVC